MKRNIDIRKFLQNNLKFLIVGLILLIILRQYAVMIIVMLLLGMLGVFTIKISRVVPNISAETVTASSILIGYVYGWQWGLVFGLATGTIGYVNASQLNMTTIVVTLVMGFVGIMGFFFHSLGYQFWLAFLLSYFLRANLCFFLNYMLRQNTVENFMHSYVESVYNMVVVIHFMNIFYTILAWIR